MIEKALANELVAHSLHWYLELERNNTDNSEEMRAHFQAVYDELMDSLEEDCPAVYASLTSAIQLRERLLALSNYIKDRKEKID